LFLQKKNYYNKNIILVFTFKKSNKIVKKINLQTKIFFQDNLLLTEKFFPLAMYKITRNKK